MSKWQKRLLAILAALILLIILIMLGRADQAYHSRLNDDIDRLRGNVVIAASQARYERERREFEALEYMAPYNPPLTEEERREVARVIIEVADAWDLPLYLILSHVGGESGFRPEAVGGDGERGLLQILPATFYHYRPGGNINDWRETLDAGAEYLSECRSKAERDYAAGAVYYNAGKGTPAHHVATLASRGGVGIYVRRILKGIYHP